METLNLNDNQDPALAQCRQAAVYVDGLRRDDLCVLDWEVLPAPQLGKCSLALRLPAGICSAGTMEAGGLLPEPGTRIRLEMEDGGEGQFLGVVTEHRLEADQKGIIWVAQALSLPAALMSKAIARRFQINDGLPVLLDNAHVHFNSGAQMLASNDLTEIAGRQCRAFDSRPDSRRWSVADALAYLMAAELPSQIEAQSAEELAELAGDVDLGELNVTAMPLGEALVEIARRGGLAMRSRRQGLGIVFYAPGRQGRAREVSLQPPGALFSPGASNLLRGRVHLTGAGAPTVVAIGDYKTYEATFELSPGWDGGLETSQWRDFVRSQSKDWQALSNVFRRWVLNEHGWYNDEPWNLPQHDLSAIGGDFKLAIPRRFRTCVSNDSSGQSPGVVVEVRCGTSGLWQRWSGPVWISGGECAIYLGGDCLPGDFFQAALKDEAAVRVTAAVQSDVRIVARHEGDASAAQVVLDCSRKAHWRSVHSSSIFYSPAAGSAACDDTDLLAQWAQVHARALKSSSRGELTLGWIDTAFHAGDLIRSIGGQGLDLSSSDCCPCVQAVRHDFQAQQTTLGIGG